jgi:TolB-like protein
MPFANHSGEVDSAALVGGIVDDISVALTRFSALYVVSYLDAGAESSAAVVPPSVSYRLEGGVRAGGNQIRITARLIDNHSGQLLWAENFDGSAEQVFALHDQIAFKVASHIDSTVERTEMHRATQAPAQTTDGHELYWRANALFRRWDQAAIEESIALTDALLGIEPDNAWALALGGFCRAIAASWSGEDADHLAADAIARCCRAAAQAPHDAHVSGFAAGAFLMLGHDLDAARDFAERTLALHPGSALALFWNAWVDLFRGDLKRAGQRFSLAQELSPQSAAGGFTLAGLGLCHLLADDPEAALPLLRDAAQRAPDYVATRVALCACLSVVAPDAEVQQAAAELAEMPAGARFIATFERPEHRQRLEHGLALPASQVVALQRARY